MGRRREPKGFASPSPAQDIDLAEVVFMRKLWTSIVVVLTLVVLLTLLAVPAQAATWTPVKGGDNIHYYVVDLVDASHVWAGGVTFIPEGSVGFEDSAIIGRSTSGGATWDYSTSHKAGDLSYGWNFRIATALDFVDAIHGWAALSDGTIVATTDGGATWKLQAEGSFEMRDNNWGYGGLSMADATHGVAVGSWVGFIGVSKPRIVYTQNGKDWVEATVPALDDVALDSVHMVDATHGWAVGSVGRTDATSLILVTKDGGATWTRQAAGLASAALHGVWFVDGQHGWAVGDKGAILVTADAGATWWEQRSTVSEDLLAVTFSDAANGWAVGRKGTIVHVTTSGSSSQEMSTGRTATLHSVASAGGVVWVAGEDGTLLKAEAPTGDTPGGVFTDVASSPYKTAIQSLAAAGIVGGFPDGTFRPDSVVRRAQFAKMLLGTLGILPGESTSTRFMDLGTPDANGYPHKWVQAAFERGITTGLNAAQTLFGPFNTIRRDQATSMIVRGAQRVMPGVLETPPAATASLFATVDPPHGDNLRIAEYNGLLDGLVGLGPKWDVTAPATRGEVAQMLYNLKAAQMGD
jgi:photosystem II stability/assembly factor-like uncharacterized protein